MSRGVKYMLVASFSFSLMTLFVKMLAHIPALEVVFFRSIVSLVLSISYLRYHKIYMFGHNKKYLILRGVFGVVALSLFFITLQNIPLASAVTVQYLSPIFTIVIGIYMLGEKVKPIQWLYFLVAFAGAAMIKGFDERVSTLYFLLGVGSALFAGFAYNCVRKVKDTDHPWVVVFYFPLVATPFTGIYTAFNWVPPSGYDWLVIIFMGIFTQLGQVFMTKALHADKLSTVTVLKYLRVIYAIIYGLIFFGEKYSIMAYMGMALVLLGIILNLRLKEKGLKSS